MLAADVFDQTVASRLEECWTSRTPWQRRLWNTGTVAAVSELLEASENPMAEALKTLQTDVVRLTGPDPGVGDSSTRRYLKQLLTGDLVFRGVRWHSLQPLLSVIDTEYVGRWANLLPQPQKP